MDTPFRDCLKSEESVDSGTALELLKTLEASGDELNALASWDENVRVDSITYEFKNTSSLYLGSGCIYGPQLNSQHLRLRMESSGLQQQWVALQTRLPGLWTTPSGLYSYKPTLSTDLQCWFLFHCCDNANLRKERFAWAHSLRVQSITVGKSWRWENKTEWQCIQSGGKET